MMIVQADASKQLLSFGYSQRVDVEDIKIGVQQVSDALREMQPGFRLLNDLSNLEVMDPGCAPYIMEIMKMCNDKEIATVVRVIPDPGKDIGFSIMSRFHYSPEVKLRIYENLEDALESLE